jgi:hypothetical protein
MSKRLIGTLLVLAFVGSAYGFWGPGQSHVGLVAGWDFEDQMPGGVSADVSGVPDASPCFSMGATVVWDAARNSYVLDTAQGPAIAPVDDGDPTYDKYEFASEFTLGAWVYDREEALQPAEGGWNMSHGWDGALPRIFPSIGEGAGLGAAHLLNADGSVDGWNPNWTIPYNPNTWQHILYTFDGDIAYMYIDGVLNSSVDRTGIGVNGIGDFKDMDFGFGHSTHPDQSCLWNGMLDDVFYAHGSVDAATALALARGTLDMHTAPIVPEPATIALLGLGGLAMFRRKK